MAREIHKSSEFQSYNFSYFLRFTAVFFLAQLIFHLAFPLFAGVFCSSIKSMAWKTCIIFMTPGNRFAYTQIQTCGRQDICTYVLHTYTNTKHTTINNCILHSIAVLFLLIIMIGKGLMQHSTFTDSLTNSIKHIAPIHSKMDFHKIASSASISHRRHQHQHCVRFGYHQSVDFARNET